jgi:outer membrane biosynthesis protein TonB
VSSPVWRIEAPQWFPWHENVCAKSKKQLFCADQNTCFQELTDAALARKLQIVRKRAPRRGGTFLLLDKLESGILALETECGSVYVQASGWERLYLLWTFRHFNSLPLKTLNSRQQRLVQRLPRCGSRTPHSTPDRTQVIGTVEGATVPYLPVVEPIATKAESEELLIPVALPTTVSARMPDRSENLSEDFNGSAPPSFAFGPGRSRVALICAVAALSTLAVTTSWHWPRWRDTSNAASRMDSNQAAQSKSATNNPPGNVATGTAIETSLNVSVHTDSNQSGVAEPVAPTPTIPEVKAVAKPAAVPSAMTSSAAPEGLDTAKSKRTPAPEGFHKPESKSNSILASIQDVGAQEGAARIEFSGPPRRLVYPEYPETSARGRVILKAIIGVDGKVREVKTISGNKLLSAAAARAIRQWRYDPFYKDGQAVETETNVGMLFVSADVISINFLHL